MLYSNKLNPTSYIATLAQFSHIGIKPSLGLYSILSGYFPLEEIYGLNPCLRKKRPIITHHQRKYTSSIHQFLSKRSMSD